MNRLLALLLGFFLLIACDDSSQHNPNVYGTVLVYISTDWLDLDRRRISDAMLTLNRTGPRFVETPFASMSDVIVRRWDSPNCETSGAGRYFLGTRVAEVDPVCTQGDTAFRAVVSHEILHVLGLTHICRGEGDPGPCSSVGYGRAVMNPYYGEEQDDPLDPVPFNDIPSDLDLAEMRRVRRIDAGR